MPSELEEQIAGLKPGDHLCLIYEDAAEQTAVITSFIKAGLQQDECCVYIADDNTTAAVAAALAAGGVDVPKELERGALVLLTKRETYLRGGQFEPKAMIEFLRQTLEQALAKGFKGLRATGEMTWALGPEMGCERLIEYEANLNTFFTGARALAICQYHKHRFAPAVIRDVLRTHPVAILGKQVCPNLYYEAPNLVLGREAEKKRVEWMIANLQQVCMAEKALRQNEERLRAQYDWSPVPTYTWRKVGDDFVLIDYNHAGKAATRGRIGECVGKTAREMYPDQPDIVEDFARAATEQGILRREMRYRFRSSGE